jgi:transcription termination/antitermination protein NusA
VSISLYQTVAQVSRARGIDAQIIISAVEDAILVAARKHYKTAENLKSCFNKKTGEVEVFAVKTTVEQVGNPAREITLQRARKIDPKAVVGSEVRIRKDTDALGRISAQAAKQVIFQKVREAKRDVVVFAEYENRVGEVVNCTVKRLEGPDVIVEMGRTEGRILPREQSRLDNCQVGHRFRVVISSVDRAARGPRVTVSRADPMLVRGLLEAEVPEVYDGAVQIRAIAREAGGRTKVAVFSQVPDVDCVGVCVGMKGTRVQSIIRELNGEKIDIIEYNEDALAFAANALSPAKVNHVSVVDAEAKRLEVLVDDTQLVLAVGKKGQNVRLAAKLLGWHIDIKSDGAKPHEVEPQMPETAPNAAPTDQLQGMGDDTMTRLQEHGVEAVDRDTRMADGDLAGLPDRPGDRNRLANDSDSRGRRAASMDELRQAYDYLLHAGTRFVLPAHHNYQVRLKEFLRKKGIVADCEQDFIDVKFTTAGRVFIGEVKVTTYLSVVEAFRAALGQILDYARATSEESPGAVIFLDQQLDRERTDLATKLGIAVVVQQGEAHQLLNPGVAPLLRDIFS